jgi:hypothetical protein
MHRSWNGQRKIDGLTLGLFRQPPEMLAQGGLVLMGDETEERLPYEETGLGAQQCACRSIGLTNDAGWTQRQARHRCLRVEERVTATAGQIGSVLPYDVD